MVWSVCDLVALVVRINPSLTGALPYLAPCQRHQVVMERDDASSWRVFYFFFERGLIFLESCDII